MRRDSYRGYSIHYHFSNRWYCHIFPPDGGSALGGEPATATAYEGSDVLLERAYRLIDTELGHIPPAQVQVAGLRA